MTRPSPDRSRHTPSRWERAFASARTPFEKFVHDEASSGLLLMGCAIVAMILANSGLSDLYSSILHTELSFQVGGYRLSHTVHHWVNDGLMALFFLVVGLEIKREILVGQLAELRRALLPIAAAIGGVVLPALIYFVLNSSESANGWAIPMATDIAFAVGALVLLGSRAPKALVGFLLALAIVDDLLAVLVIAFFYTSQILWSALAVAAVCFVLLLICNLVGLRSPLPYALLGAALWLAMLESGVHATLAGVLTALTVPASSLYSPRRFQDQVRKLLKIFERDSLPGDHIMKNDQQQAALKGIENAVQLMEAPLQRLEHSLHIWVSFLVIPIFALTNAGIKVDLPRLASTLSHPVTLGVMAGLVVGKSAGVFGASFLLIRGFGIPLPQGVRLSHLAGVSLLAGIGFTMSIFIGELAFASQPEFLLNAKIAVVVASLVAGISGWLWLYLLGGKTKGD